MHTQQQDEILTKEVKKLPSPRKKTKNLKAHSYVHHITHVPHHPRAGPRREQEEGPPAMASPSSTETSFPLAFLNQPTTRLARAAQTHRHDSNSHNFSLGLRQFNSSVVPPAGTKHEPAPSCAAPAVFFRWIQTNAGLRGSASLFACTSYIGDCHASDVALVDGRVVV